MNEPRAILAIAVSPFGQALTLLPAMRAIRAAYPRAFIAVATSKGLCELLAASGLVDETIELGVIKSPETGGGLKRLFRLMKRARRSDFDTVLDFAPRVETQVIARLVVRARTVTPSRLPHVIEIFTGKSARRDDESAYRSVLRQLGLEMNDARFGFDLPEEENAQFEKLLARKGSRGGEPIVLLYGSGAAGGWPVESFGEIAARLANNFGARIVVADEPGDKTFTDALSALLPQGAIRLAEPRALTVTAAAARASLVITDDAGFARLAAYFRAPVLEIADEPRASLSSPAHRIAQAASRARVTTDEVYEIACEMIQDIRSASLFQR
ncbi:MAG TPA: hypothetical protein VNN73_14955 [Blastocatellia bacterium]|nr:hypothetical protein [Blastocatellia bacterium]